MPNPKNKVRFGLRNVHVAMLTFEEDGAVSFGTPKAVPGAVEMSMDAQGETTTFYADDVAYYVAVANNGYQGTLTMALIPDWFAQEALGETLHETDKVLVENSSAESRPFALLFEFQGDKHAIRHVLYNCTAARPAVAGGTVSNTKDPATSALTLTAAPLADGRVKAKTTADTPEAVYSGWYGSVWDPEAAGA